MAAGLTDGLRETKKNMKRKIFIALLVVLTLGFSNPKIFVKANEDRLITYK